MVACHVGPLGRASHWLVSLQCLLSFALISVLNTWWFLKMAQGLSRLWSRGGAAGAAGKKESGGGPPKQRQRKGKDVEKGEGGDGGIATRAGASTKTTSSSKGRTRRQGKAA